MGSREDLRGGKRDNDRNPERTEEKILRNMQTISKIVEEHGSKMEVPGYRVLPLGPYSASTYTTSEQSTISQMTSIAEYPHAAYLFNDSSKNAPLREASCNAGSEISWWPSEKETPAEQLAWTTTVSRAYEDYATERRKTPEERRAAREAKLPMFIRISSNEAAFLTALTMAYYPGVDFTRDGFLTHLPVISPERADQYARQEFQELGFSHETPQGTRVSTEIGDEFLRFADNLLVHRVLQSRKRPLSVYLGEDVQSEIALLGTLCSSSKRYPSWSPKGKFYPVDLSNVIKKSGIDSEFAQDRLRTFIQEGVIMFDKEKFILTQLQNWDIRMVLDSLAGYVADDSPPGSFMEVFAIMQREDILRKIADRQTTRERETEQRVPIAVPVFEATQFHVTSSEKGNKKRGRPPLTRKPQPGIVVEGKNERDQA